MIGITALGTIVLVAKMISLFCGIAFGLVNVTNIIYKNEVTAANNFAMSAGITVFITLQCLI